MVRLFYLIFSQVQVERAMTEQQQQQEQDRHRSISFWSLLEEVQQEWLATSHLILSINTSADTTAYKKDEHICRMIRQMHEEIEIDREEEEEH
jgi:hypothetical protein